MRKRDTTMAPSEIFNEAVEKYDRAIKLNPKYAEAYYRRAAAYDALEKQTLGLADKKTAAGLGNKEAQDFLRSKGISW